jgi:hypothetical protein
VQLTLLSRAYCHLCDEMREALAPLAARHGARIVELDVDADAELEARWGNYVPVLLAGGRDGVELCHFTLDTTSVEHALAAAEGIRGESDFPL